MARVAGAVAVTVGVFLVVQYSAYNVSGLAAEAVAGWPRWWPWRSSPRWCCGCAKAAASISGELRAGMSRALETGALAVVMLAFLAVGREGVETALFMVGYAEAETAWPLVGLFAGVAVAVGIAWGMYAGAVRINLAKFFKYTGVFLIVVAAGILAYGIGALQTVGWLPMAGLHAFDISSWFNWSAWYGEIVQGRLQHHPDPRRCCNCCAGWPTSSSCSPCSCGRSSPPRRNPFGPTPCPRCRKVRLVTSPRVLTATFAALLAGLSLAGCTAKKSATTEQGKAPARRSPSTPPTPPANCRRPRARPGRPPFVVTNNGTAATEFYVYGKDNRVLGEVENISPGLQRQLVVQFDEPGSYTVACKPGMVGDGIRGDFSVTGAAFKTQDTGVSTKASEDYKTYVLGQAGELVTATAAFVASVKASDIAAAKAQYPTSRTSWERIEPVAESFPDDLDPRIDLREADLQAGQKWTGFHRLEKDLWVSGLQPDTNAVADQLLADINELQEKIAAPGFRVSATQIAGGAQGPSG